MRLQAIRAQSLLVTHIKTRVNHYAGRRRYGGIIETVRVRIASGRMPGVSSSLISILKGMILNEHGLSLL